MDMSTLLNFLKLPKTFYLLFMLTTAILLFADERFLNYLSLSEFKNEYKKWLGIVFVLTLVMCLISIGEFILLMLKRIYAVVANSYKKKKEEKIVKLAEKKQLKEITNIDSAELAIIRLFYKPLQVNTQIISLEDSSALNLKQSGVLIIIENSSYHSNITGHYATFKLSSVAIDYFKNFNFSPYANIKEPYWVELIKMQENIKKSMAEYTKNF